MDPRRALNTDTHKNRYNVGVYSLYILKKILNHDYGPYSQLKEYFWKFSKGRICGRECKYYINRETKVVIFFSECDINILYYTDTITDSNLFHIP